jgi:peptidoglycan hydrolase-like protein with peptidoglycan-binding domain
MMDAKTRAALKAFQAANELTPTGIFDHPTAERLAPFLPRSS